MIDIPDQELGELGRLIVRWANGERFPPSQAQVARHLGVSKTQLSNWLRADYKMNLKPADLRSIAQLVAPAMGASEDAYTVALNAMLRDLGLLPGARGVGHDAAPIARKQA